MKIVSWNINNGANSRAVPISRYIIEENPGIVFFQEYNSDESSKLATILKAKGYDNFYFPLGSSAKPSVVAFSKQKLAPTEIQFNQAHRALCIKYESINILGLHVQDHSDGDGTGGVNSRRLKGDFWEEVLNFVKEKSVEENLIIGDFNTGSNAYDRIKIDGKSEPDKYTNEKEFLKLSELYVDLWRRFNGSETKCFTHKRANGFRIDHAFATSSLAQIVSECRYNHEVLTAQALPSAPKISDHSMLILSIDM